MIEQIKQVLEKVTRGDDWTNMTDAGVETKYVAEYNRLTENMGGLIATCESVDAAQLIANAPEWLRYLIGEVERLKQSNSNLLKQYHQRGKDNDKVIYDLVSANTELQKGLEWYANKVNYLPYRLIDLQENVIADQGERARTVLQSIQGGDNT